MKGWFTLKFVRKLVAALTAITLVAISGLSSACMAAREFDYIAEYNRQSQLNCEYSLDMLKSIDRSIGLTKGGEDGNYFKKGNLTDEEKKIYEEIVGETDKIKNTISQKDSDYEVKLAKAVFLWIRKNIKYDEESVSLDAESNTIEGKFGVKKNSENRKPQDALTVFSNQRGLCEGIVKLAQLMMKIAGLSCVGLGDHSHAFNAVWLGGETGGWALFDATAEEAKRQNEQDYFNEGDSVKSKYNHSIDNMILDLNFPAAYRYGSSPLKTSNESFITGPFGGRNIYVVYDDSADFYKCFTNYNGVCYALTPATLVVEIDNNSHNNNNSIFVDEKMLKYKTRCMINGNIKCIKNFNVFYKNFVRVDVSRSHIEQTLKKDGVEFKLSCNGEQSNLIIKSLEDGKNFDAVTIPNELIPFLPDIDKFDVDSNIKTVKYDLLWKENTLKEGAIPNGVKFEQVDFIKYL